MERERTKVNRLGLSFAGLSTTAADPVAWPRYKGSGPSEGQAVNPPRLRIARERRDRTPPARSGPRLAATGPESKTVNDACPSTCSLTSSRRKQAT